MERSQIKRNYIHRIILHLPENADNHALSDKVSQFHADIIERRLRESALTAKEKLAVIDNILSRLKEREGDNSIT